MSFFYWYCQDELLTTAVLGHDLCGLCQKEISLEGRVESHTGGHLLDMESEVV